MDTDPCLEDLSSDQDGASREGGQSLNISSSRSLLPAVPRGEGNEALVIRRVKESGSEQEGRMLPPLLPWEHPEGSKEDAAGLPTAFL